MQRVLGAMSLTVRIVCLAPLLMLQAGCGGSGMPNDEQADFGAGVVARYVVTAQQKCGAAGTPDLYECTAAPASKAGERVAARTALDVYQIFQRNCYETAGSEKCDTLMEAAYRKASTQQASSP